MTTGRETLGLDVGVVVADPASALNFYCGRLGLQHAADVELPDGRTMHRLASGSSLLKVVPLGEGTEASGALAPLAARGFRYVTVRVGALDDVVASLRAAGTHVAAGPLFVRPGVRIAMLEDPDGNYVELLESSG